MVYQITWGHSIYTWKVWQKLDTFIAEYSKKQTISLLIIIYSKLFACEVNTGSCIHLQPISLKQYVLPKISSIVVLDRTQMSNSLATCKGLFDLSSAARLSRRAGKGSWWIQCKTILQKSAVNWISELFQLAENSELRWTCFRTIATWVGFTDTNAL